jgi:hypothetical protein
MRDAALKRDSEEKHKEFDKRPLSASARNVAAILTNSTRFACEILGKTADRSSNSLSELG